MRILYIQYGNIFNPHAHGGIAHSNHQLFEMITRNHDLTVFTGLADGQKSTFHHEGVCYIQKGFFRNKWLNRMTFILNCIFMHTDAFDIKIIVWDRYAPVIPTTQTIPTLIEVHSDFLNTPPKSLWLNPITKMLFKFTIKISRHVACVSNALCKQITHLNRHIKHNRLIHNAIDDIFFQSIQEKKGEYLLFLGRYDITIKGIDTLIQAYKLANMTVPLKMAGGGSDQSRIRDMIDREGLSDKIELLGWVEGAEKNRLLQQAIALVLPSRFEGLPAVIAEALALGKPIIGSNINGIREAIQNNKTGLLVDPEDIKGFSKAFQRVLDQSFSNESFKQCALEAAQSYKKDFVLKERLELFHDILKTN